MENKDFEFRYNMSLINFYKSHIDKLFFVSFITSMITLSVSFDVIHFIPLIIICYIDNIFYKCYYKAIELRTNILIEQFGNVDRSYKKYLIEIKDISFKCGVLFVMFIILIIYIIVFFWISVMKYIM